MSRGSREWATRVFEMDEALAMAISLAEKE
jgi:hypothetical protein